MRVPPVAVAVMCAIAVACGPAQPAPVPSSLTPDDPAPGASSTATREGPSFTFTATGDIGSDDPARASLSAMAQTGAELHLLLGDLSYAGPDSEAPWCALVTATLGRDAAVQLLAGNHEADGGQDGHISEFRACLPDRMMSQGTYGAQYYFDIPRLARFVLLSPDLQIDGKRYLYARGSAHYEWAREAIAGARNAGLPWVIVGMHKSCLSVGAYECTVGDNLMSLLVDGNVDLVLHGHDHNYQRTHQLRTGAACAAVRAGGFDPDCVADAGEDGRYAKGGGAVFVIAGVAGSKFYDVNAGDPESGYFATSMGANKDRTSGFLRVALTTDELRADFVNSTGESHFTDAFTIAE